MPKKKENGIGNIHETNRFLGKCLREKDKSRTEKKKKWKTAFQPLNARATKAKNVGDSKKKNEKKAEWYQINICLLNVINNGI